ncbi:MAG TPA: regulatory protein RecX [Flavobacteriaceae bacterium]|nr:regulatory protein RecX [Flavobacteriaceae bacterium]
MNQKKTYTVEEAIGRMERYCAYQERCHKEVEQKLWEMQMIPEARDHIILHLIQHDFLNESRFAQAFARGKFRTKKWGKIRIVQELKLRNISAYNIKLALKEIPDSDYYATFEQLFQKRMAQLSQERDGAKKRKKLVDYLFYRGWESEMVYDAINRN